MHRLKFLLPNLVILIRLIEPSISDCSKQTHEKCNFANNFNRNAENVFCGWQVDKDMQYTKCLGLRPRGRTAGRLTSRKMCSDGETDHCLTISFKICGENKVDKCDDGAGNNLQDGGELSVTFYVEENDTEKMCNVSTAQLQHNITFTTRDSYTTVIEAARSGDKDNGTMFISEVYYFKGLCSGVNLTPCISIVPRPKPATPIAQTPKVPTTKAPTAIPKDDDTHKIVNAPVIAIAAVAFGLVLALSCAILLLLYRQNKLSCLRRNETQLSDCPQGHDLKEADYEATEDMRGTSEYYSIISIQDCVPAPEAPPHDDGDPAASEVVDHYQSLEPDGYTHPLIVHGNCDHPDNTVVFDAVNRVDAEGSHLEVCDPNVYNHLNEGTYNHIGEVTAKQSARHF